jgi:M6 family metalloprotease-like protein
MVVAVLSSTVGPLFAMPPYQGIQEPEALKAMRLKGMDSPQRGIERELSLRTKDGKISGSREYPVVMGYFTDLAAINTQAEFQGMLFNTGTNNKSVNNYYRDMSYNAMSCSGKVDDWRNSGNTVAYFSVNDGLNGGTTANTYEFIRNTLVHADSFVDFSAPGYDLNNDGYVDVLWVTHAGKGAEEGASNIWSHSFYLSGFGSGATYYTTKDPWPGHAGQYMKIDDYIINPERTNYADGVGATTEMIGCGVFCHEFGHALGLPDLYDTDASGYGSGSGLGNWSLMAGGSWGGNGSTNARPAALDVWCRRFLGWASPNLVTNDNLYTVNSIMVTASGSSYKLAKLGADTTKQYWLIENRYELGTGPVSGVRWDSLLLSSSPGGLAIYHIDSTYTTATYLSNNTVNNKYTSGGVARPYGVAMEETDMTTAGYSSELWNGSNNGDAADIWTSSTQANFDSNGTAYPVSYYNGTTSTTGGAHSGVAARQIPAGSAAMSCSLLVGVATGVEGRPETVSAPSVFALQNAWPNPARGQVNFRYQLPRAAQVDIRVYNVLGQTVKAFDRGVQEPGYYSLKWSDANVAEGVYFVRLQAGDYRATRKFVVVQ